jgi:hypothetical protein
LENITIKTVVFQRPERDGGTTAIAHFHMVDDTRPPLARLKEALTKWVAFTSAGRDAWKSSSEDFNIGDLRDWYGDSMLHYLNEEGITSIVFEAVRDNNEVVAYDERLVNDDEIDFNEPVGMEQG